MNKLTIVVEDSPSRPSKNAELFQEVVVAFNGLALGKSFVINDAEVKSTSLEANIRSLITPERGERLKISRIKDSNGKLTAIRLSKLAAIEPKAAKSQGEV